MPPRRASCVPSSPSSKGYARSPPRVSQGAGGRNDRRTGAMIAAPMASRFMLRPDDPSQTKLQQLIQQIGVSRAEIIRHLIAQAKPEDFPKSWQMRASERHVPQARPSRMSNTHEKTLLSTRRVLWYGYRNHRVMSRETAWQVSLTLLQRAGQHPDTPVRGDRDGIRWQPTDPAAASKLE
jgi:hypothetical protein